MVDGKRLSYFLKKSKISSQKLLDKLNDIGIDIGLESIKKYRTITGNIPSKTLSAIAEILNIPEQELFINAERQKYKIVKQELKNNLYKYENLIPSHHTAPLIGDASCEVPDEHYYENIEKQIIIPEELWSERVYCVRAVGDSMLPRITPGTICVVDPDAPIENNDTIHFNWSSESGIRKWSLSEDGKNLTFMPTNISIKNLPLVVNLPTEEILRCAKVVQIISDP